MWRFALVGAAVSGVMALPQTDTFGRGPATGWGANWTVAIGNTNDWLIDVSNNAFNVVGAYEINYWSANAANNDQSASVAGAMDMYGGPAVRVSSTGGGQGYAYQCKDHKLMKFSAGSPSDLDTSHTACANGDTVLLQIVGTTLTVKINGVQDGSTTTDSSFASGSVGVLQFGGLGSFNTWTGDNVGGGGAVFPKGIPNNPIRCCFR